jgi:hypothetical protein
MSQNKGNLAIITNHKKIAIGVVVVLVGIFFYMHHQNNQVDRVIKNHTYKITVTGPNYSGETTKQHGALIFANTTYKESHSLDEDFSDLSGLVDSARENDSESYTATKDAITLNSGYADAEPSDDNVAHLKNLKVSNGGKTITGDINYEYEDDSAVENNPYAYDDVSTKTAHATVQLERIK